VIQYLKKTNGQLEQLASAEKDCWINIYPPYSKEEVEKVSTTLDIPIEFLIDSLDIDERSRFEADDGVQLIVVNTPVKNQDESEYAADYITVPIGIIEVEDYIVTISSQQNPVIDFFLNRKVKDFNPTNHSDFVLRIMDKNVYYFLHYLKRINSQRNLYEKELFNSSRNSELSKLMNLQKSLIYFATTLRDVEIMTMKLRRTNFLKIRGQEDEEDFLEDILIDSSQAREMSDVYTNIINTTVDSYASIISNNLNMVLRRLTTITIILMVPTLVASFFGMNVALPFAESAYAFPITIGLSVLLAVGAFMFFRRQELF